MVLGSGSQQPPQPSQAQRLDFDAAATQPVPLLCCLLPGEVFCQEVERDGLRGLLQRVQAAAPGSGLYLVVVDLDGILQRTSNAKPGRKPAVESARALLLAEHQGVYFRTARDADEAAEVVLHLTWMVAEQPYRPEKDMVEVFAGGSKTAKEQLRGLGGAEEARLVWIKSLAHIPGIGPKNARAIAST